MDSEPQKRVSALRIWGFRTVFVLSREVGKHEQRPPNFAIERSKIMFNPLVVHLILGLKQLGHAACLTI